MILSGSAAAFGAPRGSGLAATLPRLYRPDPALAEMLTPDPFRLSDRHHPGTAPAVAPHPDVHLVDMFRSAATASTGALQLLPSQATPDAAAWLQM